MTKKWLAALAALVLAALSPLTALADKTDQYNYTYGPNGIVASVPGFDLARTLDSGDLPEGTVLRSVDDLVVGGGRLYVADALGAQIHVFDSETFTHVVTIQSGSEEAGGCPLAGPKGVCFSETLGELYIADPAAQKVFVLDGETYALKRSLGRPENMTGDTQFAPYRIAVDTIGRLYIVVQNSHEGIVELNPDGGFSRYLGLNKPKINLIEYFWRSLATDEQKKQMAKAYAPSFGGVDLDGDGFVFAVTGDTSSEEKVFRFNAKGDNVIRAEGYDKLVGDVPQYFENSETSSVFTDVATTDFGAYAVLDRQNGRVFVYDFDGYLITIFSGLGYMKGDLAEASSLAWNGYDLLVGDRERGMVMVYMATDFGRSALMAVESYNKGEWDRATELYQTALSHNANFYAGYSGLGRNYLMERDFSQAVYYYKLAKDDEGYSQAFQGYRETVIQRHFGWFVAAFLLLAAVFIYTEIRYARRKGGVG